MGMNEIDGASGLAVRYRNEGFVSPLRAVEANEMHEIQARYLALCEPGALVLRKERRLFGHMLYPWVADLVRHPHVLDPVRRLIGPNVLVWVSEFVSKGPRSEEHFTWHQDGHYWGYEDNTVASSAIPLVTVWFAVFPASEANGCMRVIPGSHTRLVPHRERPRTHNMLTRGQEIEGEIDERRAVHIELDAGEFSIHHPYLYHASAPNLSSHPRVGLVVRYISPSVVPSPISHCTLSPSLITNAA